MATETPPPVATEAAPDETREPAPRRTVTLPVLPLVIIGAIIVALVFFGGGVAVGVAIGDHSPRLGTVQPFGGENGQNGQNRYGPQGGQNGFGQNRQNRQNGQRGQNGNGQHLPTNRPSGAPKNG